MNNYSDSSVERVANRTVNCELMKNCFEGAWPETISKDPPAIYLRSSMNSRMLCLLLVLFTSVLVISAGTTLYTTAFEASEGYNGDFALAGQRGWLADGSGGNGIVTNFFEGFGQQAFIGFIPPTNSAQSTTLWTPINFNPTAGATIVKFSTTLQLFKSTTGGDDEFRWAVYNQASKRMFSIDFFMSSQAIYYELENQQATNTGFTFDVDGSYDLVSYMDFERNQWTAFLNDRVIANALPIRLTNSTALNLGDVDAVWFINNAQSPGDNYMVFDDYTITAENITSIPAALEDMGMTPEHFYQFRVFGEIGVKYAIDVTTDFKTWDQLYPDPGQTFVNTDGSFIFKDTTAPEFSRGFYRVRSVP